jgi:pyruvate kinase
VARQLVMVWGVYPVVIDEPKGDAFDIREELQKICDLTCSKGFADPEKDLLTVTAGLPFGTVGICNYLRVIAAAGPNDWFDEETNEIRKFR